MGQDILFEIVGLSSDITATQWLQGEAQAVWPLIMTFHAILYPIIVVPLVGFFGWLLTTIGWEVLFAITLFGVGLPTKFVLDWMPAMEYSAAEYAASGKALADA